MFIYFQEWQEELKLLLETLRTESGKIRTVQPDKNRYPEAASAWEKVRAVNGKFTPSVTLRELMRPNEVTRQLGRVVHIQEAEVRQGSGTRRYWSGEFCNL